MTEADPVDRVVTALWPERARSRAAIFWATSTTTMPGWKGPGVAVKERELAKALRSSAAPDVVVLGSLSPTLLRALREAAPPLLVVTGDLEPSQVDELRRLPGCWVLGPNASVRVGEPAMLRASDATIACAHESDELEGLSRALGHRSLALALSPTPAWLWRLLEHPRVQGCAVAGYVAATNLSSAWVRWVRRSPVDHVLVPVGVQAADLDDPDDADLATIVAAHALERRTGPVFPSPRVLALVLDHLGDASARRETEQDPEPPGRLELWDQARRSLPITGAAVGMEAPQPGIRTEVPTAAFFAQRALLRARAFEQAVAEPPSMPPPPDDEGLERALEIMRNAGQVLTDQESKVVLRGLGFEVTRQAVASSASGAAGFAERIGFPVVLKALSPDLRRRSDVGGVVLGLSTAAAVRRAYASIVDNVERQAPTARMDGVLVAEMLPEGLDIRCGGRRLDSGEVVLYGVLEGASFPLEPALALAPMEPQDAVALAHAVLSRAPVPALRRESDPDVHGLAEVFLRLCTLFAQSDSRIESVDLGPVRLIGPPRGYVTLDARIVQAPHLEGL